MCTILSPVAVLRAPVQCAPLYHVCALLRCWSQLQSVCTSTLRYPLLFARSTILRLSRVESSLCQLSAHLEKVVCVPDPVRCHTVSCRCGCARESCVHCVRVVRVLCLAVLLVMYFVARDTRTL